MKQIPLVTTAALLAVMSANLHAQQGQDAERRGDQRRGGESRGGFSGGMLRMSPVTAALDADGNGEISSQEIEGAVTALKGLDKNKDGKLVDEELRPRFARGRDADGGAPGGRFGGNLEEFVARVMEEDKNKDGKLTKDEASERSQGLITRADRDNDGAASKDELMAAFRPSGAFSGGTGGGRAGFGGPPSAERFVERALEFDADKDGKLNKEELTKWAEQMGRGFGGQRDGDDRPQRPQRPERASDNN